MASKMLIDASHPEETRVVVMRGKQVEEFDFESTNRKQVRGNIYLAKVVRVEPSLQAAFVEYGGNRHGFLSFSEIHPDYYQIPAADRKALLQEELDEVENGDAESTADDSAAANRPDSVKTADSKKSNQPKSTEVDNATAANQAGAASAVDSANSGHAETPAVNDAAVANQSGSASAADSAKSGIAESSAGDDAADANQLGSVSAADSAQTNQLESSRSDGPVATNQPKTASSIDPPAADQSESLSSIDSAVANHSETSKEYEKPKTVLTKSFGTFEFTVANQPASENTDESLAKNQSDIGTGEDSHVSGRDISNAGDDSTSSNQPTLGKTDGPSTENQSVPEKGSESPTPIIRKSASRKNSAANDGSSGNDADLEQPDEEIESLGGDALEEIPLRKKVQRKQYKIQDVIKSRQILLVQVLKEERGKKGVALTTYISLAGRFSVLMPNTNRGGGISRKIASVNDRKRLKQIASSLDIPEGMGVIIRTAGASRKKNEIERDYEFLIRQWEEIRDFTFKSVAPCLIFEEGSLIKRSIRDLYSKEINKILVSGEEGFKEASDYMSMLMPNHAKTVQQYKDPSPIYAKHEVEDQLEAMFNPIVKLKSGGYIVINQTEALVAIDVNSGKSTREHNIEDTALQTNMEASEEIARQLRLRDLAGLIVVDFIDMDERKNNKTVEKRIKECLSTDRARIQVGRISAFGLFEMSRQRLRSGLLESSTVPCSHCDGTGVERSTESVALLVLREIEDNLLKKTHPFTTVKASTSASLYILNHKRQHIGDMEARFGTTIQFETDDKLQSQNHVVILGEESEGSGKTEKESSGKKPKVVTVDTGGKAEPDSDEEGAKRKNRKKRRKRNPNAETNATANTLKTGGESQSDKSKGEIGSATANSTGDTATAPRKKVQRRGIQKPKNPPSPEPAVSESQPPVAANDSASNTELGVGKSHSSEAKKTVEKAIADNSAESKTANPVGSAETPSADANPVPKEEKQVKRGWWRGISKS